MTITPASSKNAEPETLTGKKWQPAALMVVGAWVRHYFNLRHEGRTVWWIPATAALAVVVIAVLIRPSTTSAPAASGPVTFARVQAIIATRCSECHSLHPSNAALPAKQ